MTYKQQFEYIQAYYESVKGERTRIDEINSCPDWAPPEKNKVSVFFRRYNQTLGALSTGSGMTYEDAYRVLVEFYQSYFKKSVEEIRFILEISNIK